MEGASTACFPLAGHDGILPRGSLLPPSSILHSSPFSSPLPPSICVHLPPSLPPLPSSRHPHHNRSISYNVSILDLKEKSCFSFLCFFSSLHHLPFMDACSDFPLSLSSSFNLLFTSCSSTSALSSALLAGYVFLQHATSTHHPDLCNGDAPAGC